MGPHPRYASDPKKIDVGVAERHGSWYKSLLLDTKLEVRIIDDPSSKQIGLATHGEKANKLWPNSQLGPIVHKNHVGQGSSLKNKLKAFEIRKEKIIEKPLEVPQCKI